MQIASLFRVQRDQSTVARRMQLNLIFFRFVLSQKEKAQGFRERLQSIQDVLLRVQSTMDAVASMCERVKK